MLYRTLWFPEYGMINASTFRVALTRTATLTRVQNAPRLKPVLYLILWFLEFFDGVILG